jgi:spermidine synthase
MAVIWQKTVHGKIYEVRAAGQTRRLYRDGVLHSQYNPNKALTGNVWDLLSLPCFFLAPEKIHRVLVLGVGGGAVVQQISRWFPDTHIAGMEIDKTHIAIARKFFHLRGKHINLIHADAIEWVKRYRGPPFDIVIEDLFGEQGGEPVRVIAANKSWLEHLNRLMTPHAALIMNFVEARDLRASAALTEPAIKQRYKMAYRFMIPPYENQIGVFLSQPCKKKEWRRRIAGLCDLDRQFQSIQHKYRIRKLF